MKRIVKQCHSNPSIESANSQTKKKKKNTRWACHAVTHYGSVSAVFPH